MNAPFSNRGIGALAICTVIGARLHPVSQLRDLGIVVVLVLAVMAIVRKPGQRTLFVCATVCVLVASVLSERALSGLRVAVGPWSGRATVLSDPQRRVGSVSFIARIDGKHVLVSVPSRTSWRLGDVKAGEEIEITGRVSSLLPPVKSWMVGRHIAGRMTVQTVGSRYPGSALARFANGVRGTLLRSGRVLPLVERSLFAGFVLGDDTEQPPEVADDFRASGLTHLLVVSGQNVAFTLAVFESLFRRMRRTPRLLGVLAILVVFAAITRFEPSVVRAAMMAALVAFTRYSGRPQESVRIVALAVIICVLIDPLLAWSVGFGLSVAACFGLAVLAKPIEALTPGPLWLARPLATTLAAQAATALLLVPIFGGVPIVAPLANLLALPAAAPVMTWGVAAGIPAGLLGANASKLVHIPTRLLLGWVAAVARWCAQIPLGSFGQYACIAMGVIALWLLRRVRTLRVDDAMFAVVLRRHRWAFALVLLVASVLPSVRAFGPTTASPRGPANAEFFGVDRSGIARRANVVVIRHGVDVSQLLGGLRAHRIRAIDVLVVAGGGRPQAATVRALQTRVPVGTVLVGDRSLVSGRLPGWVNVVEAQPAQEMVLGRVTIRVTAVTSGRIVLTVS
jgi:competence protein ComEC